MNIWDAAFNGNIERIKFLLDNGMDVNSKDIDGKTPLAIASRRSNTTSSLETVKFLLSSGSRINTKDNKGWTPLMLASRNSNSTSSLETVKMLLWYDADPNMVDNEEYTALIRTVMNTTGDSSLETVKILLEKGANVNYINNDGLSVLIAACRFSNSTSSLETVKFLLEKGADPNLGRKYRFPLLISVNNINDGSSLETIKILLDNGGNINIRNIEGDTALIIATRKDDNYLVKFLLEKGANPDIKTNMGVSPLMIAAQHSKIEIMNLLLKYGADPFDNNIYCPLEECTKLINKTRWERLSLRDKQASIKYNQQIPISKDVWLIIMRHKRQQQLCSNISSEKHKEILKYFALELDIPLEETQNMTKGQLCGIISRQISYREYDKIIKERRNDKMRLLEVANKYGIDTTKSLDHILNDLAKIF